MLLLRYHYNVSTTRLDTHISCGRSDNLIISACASHNDLWVIVMDADQRCKDQRHMVTDNSHLQGVRPSETGATELLPREWISQLWDKGYFITAFAGALLPADCHAVLRLCIVGDPSTSVLDSPGRSQRQQMQSGRPTAPAWYQGRHCCTQAILTRSSAPSPHASG